MTTVFVEKPPPWSIWCLTLQNPGGFPIIIYFKLYFTLSLFKLTTILILCTMIKLVVKDSIQCLVRVICLMTFYVFALFSKNTYPRTCEWRTKFIICCLQKCCWCPPIKLENYFIYWVKMWKGRKEARKFLEFFTKCGGLNVSIFRDINKFLL